MKTVNKSNHSSFVDLDNARVEEQRQVMRDIIAAGHCPFCRENLDKYHKQPMLKEGKFWLLTYNQWPYQFTKLHLLAIYKTHAEKLSELDSAAGQELIQMLQWAEKEFNVPGGAFAIRFGDTNYSAGTVAHIHAQFILPDIHHLDYLQKPVKIKVGKTTELK